MDDYLDKFGFTPEEFGLKPAAAPVSPASPKKKPVPPPAGNSFCSTPLRDLPLAMAYVPMQHSIESYDPAMALSCGTLFPALNKPLTLKKD